MRCEPGQHCLRCRGAAVLSRSRPFPPSAPGFCPRRMDRSRSGGSNTHIALKPRLIAPSGRLPWAGMADLTSLTVAAHIPIRRRLQRALLEYVDAGLPENLVEVSIEAIARSARVSRATAYRHFGNRDGLIAHALVEVIRRGTGELVERQASIQTVAAKIEEAFAYMTAAARSDTALGRLLSSRPNDEIGRAFKVIAIELMLPTYRAAQADGQLRDDLPVEEIASWLEDHGKSCSDSDSTMEAPATGFVSSCYQ
jgi:AcrR family transcriptional regulator